MAIAETPAMTIEHSTLPAPQPSDKRHPLEFGWIAAHHPRRAECAAFVRDRFREIHGVSDYRVPEDLLALFNTFDKLLATVGVSSAEAGPLFAEQYLSVPVERAVSQAVRTPVYRAHVVEVGSLAAEGPREALVMATTAMGWLEGRGARWGIFTATRQVRRLLRTLGLHYSDLATADSRQLESSDVDWGTYYENDPRVLVASVEQARCVLDAVSQSDTVLCGLRAAARASGVSALEGSRR